MSELNPENLSASDLLKRALPAHGANEHALQQLLRALADPGNGKVLHLPGNSKALRITGPTDREILAAITNALCASLQTQRLMFAALEGVALSLNPPTCCVTPLTQPESINNESMNVNESHGPTFRQPNT